jgi:glucokinase
MAVLGIDLGGTKLASAVFSEEGVILIKETIALEKREGREVGLLITKTISRLLKSSEGRGYNILSIGISVPGISNTRTGRIWAPNIPGWTDYPLFNEASAAAGSVPVIVDNDRASYILGEIWQGNAKGCRDVIYLSVGTGIGAGIVVNGEVLRGSNDVAGSTGWMALDRPFDVRYTGCGCFEYHASGDGIAKVTQSLLSDTDDYSGELRKKEINKITSRDVFKAYENGDRLAMKVIGEAVEYWGMAAANFVSIFNPEKIIFGGGVFGPARSLLPSIIKEATKWAQPVSIKQVSFDVSGLGSDAGVYGAGYLALKALKDK